MGTEQSEGDGKDNADQHHHAATLNGGETNAEPTRNQASHSEKLSMWKDPQWWQVWVQAVLVPAGVYALVIYSGQLNEMKRSTGAVVEATTLARDNAHLDQRAWVATAGVTGKPEVGKLFSISIRTKNTGKTFARSVDARVFAIALPKGEQPDFSFEEREKYFTARSRSLVAPNAESSTELDFRDKISQHDLDQIILGEKVYFVYGKIIYKDVFDCPHWTTFCSHYDAEGGGRFIDDETHNDADMTICP